MKVDQVFISRGCNEKQDCFVVSNPYSIDKFSNQIEMRMVMHLLYMLLELML